MDKYLFNFKLKSIFVFLLLILTINFSNVSANPIIIETLDKLHNSLQEIGSRKITKDNIKKLNNVIEETYDIKKMSKIILGEYWVNANVNQKKSFIKKFTEFISSNYLKRFSTISKLEIKYGKIKKINEKYTMAFTKLNFTKNDSLEINYLLIKNNEKWQIFDLLLDGSISEIATKKSEFSMTLKKGGINSLIKMLEKISN